MSRAKEGSAKGAFVVNSITVSILTYAKQYGNMEREL
jgi:hypothetical protein